MPAPLHCPGCHAPQPEPGILDPPPEKTACPACGRSLEVILFPARRRAVPPASGAGQSAGVGDAVCFYHAGRTATVPCDRCGRFLCPLCDLEFGRRHYCPRCLETGYQDHDLSLLVHYRVLYDSLALFLAALPMLFFFFPTLVTAPIVLFIAARYWRAPGSLLPRRRGRMAAAVFLAGLQALAWVALIGWFVYSLVMEVAG